MTPDAPTKPVSSTVVVPTPAWLTPGGNVEATALEKSSMTIAPA